MRRMSILLSVMIFCSAILFVGCSKQADAPKAQPEATAQAEAEPAEETAKSGDTDKAEVFALYDEFKKKFRRSRDILLNAPLVEDAYRSGVSLDNRIEESEAKEFLARFTDLLKQYREEAEKFQTDYEKYQQDLKQHNETKNAPKMKILDDAIESALYRQDTDVREQAGRVHAIRAKILGLREY